MPRAGGVSAFAFQGTNAHTVLSATCRSALTAISNPSEAWTARASHARRHWPLPPAHTLLRHAAVLAAATSCRATAIVFEADATAPGLAFLWDHRVRGLALLPATAMTEMFAGAASIAMQVGASAPHLLCWTASCNGRHIT